MATFDAGRRRAWLRIAVEGPVESGKRTNLQQLCHFYTTRWQTEVSDEHAEREWLQVEGGVVNGVPVLCRVCNLFGLAPACRRNVLSDVDAVLFVCDSTPDGVVRAAATLRRLAAETSPRLPLVIQANKQDMPTALDLETVARCLRLEWPDARVLGACAMLGEGVREALAEAIRLGVERIPEEVLASWAL
jgi:signal recognition particle receptor subunit beta